MWARNFEFMLGVWLALSPFIFHAADPPALVMGFDLTAAVVVALVALTAYAAPAGKLHLLNGVVGLAAAGFAFTGPLPVPPYHQNHVIVGLLLAMLCIIPNRASEPSRAWRDFLDREDQ